MDTPHPGLSNQINSDIAQSEIEGGVKVADIAIGAVLHIQTQNTAYTLERREDGLYLSGNQRFCPEPTKVTISGSTWGGSMLKVGFIGRGMHMEFHTEKFNGRITTSAIKDITEVL